MASRTVQHTVPVSRNEVEGPVPTRWRPTLATIVAAFVRHDYGLQDGIDGVAPVSAETAGHVRDYVEDYGETLVALPEASWDSSVCIWYGKHWDAMVDLWTEGEGRSDLVLSVRVYPRGEDYLIEVDMVYVP